MKRVITIIAAALFTGLFFAPVYAQVNINTASVDELQTLPRIGPGLARTIVEYRESHGEFKTPHDITNVPRIGEKTYNDIKDLITTGGGVDTRQADSAASAEKAVNSGSYEYEPIQKMKAEPPVPPTPAPTLDEIMRHFDNEPTILEVHRAALEYAQINQSRFIQWRRNVKTKALLPETLQFKVKESTDNDHDYTKDKTINISGGTVTLGPDDEKWVHGTDDDWDYELNLKWKPQDFLFNKEMLRVSSETHDQVSLRQNILNEVTKIYFDRRQLEIEQMLDQSSDIRVQVKRQLRLEELTAGLDALTGGYFSRALKQKAQGN